MLYFTVLYCTLSHRWVEVSSICTYKSSDTKYSLFFFISKKNESADLSDLQITMKIPFYSGINTVLQAVIPLARTHVILFYHLI